MHQFRLCRYASVYPEEIASREIGCTRPQTHPLLIPTYRIAGNIDEEFNLAIL